MTPQNLNLSNLPIRKNGQIDKNAEKPSTAGVLFYRFLIIAALFMAFCIISVTVYAFISKSLARGKPLYTIPARKTEETADVISVEDAVFSSIGRIRSSTGDEAPKTVIVSIAFPYDKEDVPFLEEFVSKIMEFRSITDSYFQSFSAEDLKNKGETAIKQDLLSKYNAVLKLGKIPALYFNDFIILE